ncbi:MAG: glycoside hydrolase family 11 protein [Defluviitaleaceae bacterium]|nr:glycoside hydrolase family 11 protein [Defluviitaleaceae bacterium]
MKFSGIAKKITAFAAAFLMAGAVIFSLPAEANQARVLTRNATSTNATRMNGFDWEAWTDHRGAEGIEMTINPDGSFAGEWTQTYNTLFRVGRRFPRNTRISSIGDISLAYEASAFQTTRGATYFGIYGWTRGPYIEWYIIDSWIDWHPGRAAGQGNIINHGTVEANGHTYDIITNWRIQQPFIGGGGMYTFLQIYSVRQGPARGRGSTAPLSGTIDVSAHFEAWADLIPPQTIQAAGRTHTASFSLNAELHEVQLVIEGFGGSEFSTGRGVVDALCLRYGSNIICSQSGCANCGAEPVATPTPTPSPTPTPEPPLPPSPTPTTPPTPPPPSPAPEPTLSPPTQTPPPTATPAPTVPPIQPTPESAPMRFQVGSLNFTSSGVAETLEAAPFIEDGRTMVPFRAIATGLGAEIDWIEATSTVVFERGALSAALPVGVPLYDADGDYMGTPVIEAGRTFVPLRYVSQVFGMNVRWDGDNQAIYIY